MMALRILPGGVHNDFEDRVTSELRSQGFSVEALTYHDQDPSFVDALRGRRSPTALAIRTRADRVCVSLRSPLEFSLEAKTALTASGNWAIEAFPLALHLLDAALDIRCLYVYHDPQRDRECGFWCNRPPRFSAILIPENSTFDVQQILDLPAFAGIPVRRIRPTRGSGDPFALINAQDVDALPDWRDLVAAADLTALEGTGT